MLNNYIILVDNHKKLTTLYRRSLAGRYRVGAETEKEALKIMRVYLGKYGSLRIYYKCFKLCEVYLFIPLLFLLN